MAAAGGGALLAQYVACSLPHALVAAADCIIDFRKHVYSLSNTRGPPARPEARPRALQRPPGGRLPSPA